MQNKIQTLHKYQSEADLSNLDKSIYISIDCLTVLLDADKQSLRKIFRELRHSLNTVIQDFKIQENLREDYFTLYKPIEDDSINLVFFQLSTYGGYEVIRIDFNPNSLKEVREPKYYITPDLYHQHLLILGIDRLKYTNNLTSKSLYKPRNQHFKTKQKAHCCRLSVRYFLKLKHLVVEFNDKCFVDFWVDFVAFWQASQ